MYKKYSFYFLVLYSMMMVLVLITKLMEHVNGSLDMAMKKDGLEAVSSILCKGRERTLEEIRGNQRMIECRRMEQGYRVDLDEREIEVLCRIVQAEAGSEDVTGKILVADVILNRVESPRFPDDVEDVVFQNSNGIYQFSPVRSGRYYEVEVTEETKEAVRTALLSEDCSGGALFFASRKYAQEDAMSWFDKNLTCVEQHGGHEFFR